MRPEVDDVRHAVVELSNAIRADTGEGAALVTGVLVVWETVEFDHDGPLHQLHYSSVGDNGSALLALGLATAAVDLIKRDGLGVGAGGDAD